MMHPEYMLLGFALFLVALAVFGHFVVKDRLAEFNRQTQQRESQKQNEQQQQQQTAATSTEDTSQES